MPQGGCISPIALWYGSLEGVGDFGIGERPIRTIKYAEDLILWVKKKETL